MMAEQEITIKRTAITMNKVDLQKAALEAIAASALAPDRNFRAREYEWDEDSDGEPILRIVFELASMEDQT